MFFLGATDTVVELSYSDPEASTSEESSVPISPCGQSHRIVMKRQVVFDYNHEKNLTEISGTFNKTKNEVGYIGDEQCHVEPNVSSTSPYFCDLIKCFVCVGFYCENVTEILEEIAQFILFLLNPS